MKKYLGLMAVAIACLLACEKNQDGRRINGAYEAIPSWQSVWGQR